MSAELHHLSGVYHFDGRPHRPSARHLRAISDSETAFLGPGLSMFSEPLGAGSARHHYGFSVSPSGNVCCWDGRLDNAAALRPCDRFCDGGLTEPMIALTAYENGGCASLRGLIGDWSLAIWDAAARTLVLASDFAGVRPLYYHVDAGSVAWSSSLAELASETGADIDEEYLIQFLAFGAVAHRTSYHGIYSVPAGSAVCISSHHVRISRFWDFRIHQTTKYADPREYEERLRFLFAEALTCRIDRAERVCAELSGGLDSSSIVSMAAQLIAARAVSTTELVTFTYDEANSPDEKFCASVERAAQAHTIHLNVRDFPLVTATQTGQSAPMWWEARFTEVSKRMAAVGSAVLLTGQLGDLIMGNWIDDSEQAADYFRQGRFFYGLKEAFAWSRVLRTPFYQVVGHALESAFTRRPPTSLEFSSIRSAQAEYGNSLSAGARKRLIHDSPLVPPDPAWSEVSPSRRKRLCALDGLLQVRKLECPESLRHVSYTHPYLHRPLVEFMLSIPPAVACRPGQPRRLMRRAFANILPESVRLRRSKAIFNSAFASAIAPMAADLSRNVHRMQLVQRGVLDATSVETRLGRLLNGLECNDAQLRSAILLEFWLRNRAHKLSPQVLSA